MSWTRIYGLALHLLPAALRDKHGAAMEALFARELERTRARGAASTALAGAAGVWDAIRRATYEHARRAPTIDFGGSTLPQLPTTQHLRRHAASFTVAFASLTAALVALYVWRQVPALREAGAPTGAIVEAVLLAIPFTAAMTIPMALLVAVLHQFTRLGADGTLAAARRERGGIRRLVAPVLVAAVCVAALELVVVAEVVPRTNTRLASVLAWNAGAPGPTHLKSDREMTIPELRAAATARDLAVGEFARLRAVPYEVEVQKKLALAASCVVLTLVGVAVALRVPRPGTRSGSAIVLGASFAVLAAYYAMMVAGESLADRLVVSPFVAMWGANAMLLAVALLGAARVVPMRGGEGSPG